MTDPGTADRTYIGPMSADLVEEILEKVSRFMLSVLHLQPYAGQAV